MSFTHPLYVVHKEQVYRIRFASGMGSDLRHHNLQFFKVTRKQAKDRIAREIDQIPSDLTCLVNEHGEHLVQQIARGCLAEGKGMLQTDRDVSILDNPGCNVDVKDFTPTPFRGTYPCGPSKWGAVVDVDGTPVYLGLFADRATAGQLYDQAALAYLGPLAMTNMDLRMLHQMKCGLDARPAMDLKTNSTGGTMKITPDQVAQFLKKNKTKPAPSMALSMAFLQSLLPPKTDGKIPVLEDVLAGKDRTRAIKWSIRHPGVAYDRRRYLEDKRDRRPRGPPVATSVKHQTCGTRPCPRCARDLADAATS